MGRFAYLRCGRNRRVENSKIHFQNVLDHTRVVVGRGCDALHFARCVTYRVDHWRRKRCDADKAYFAMSCLVGCPADAPPIFVGSEKEVFDVVVTRSLPGCPRHVAAGGDDEQVVASGRLAWWLLLNGHGRFPSSIPFVSGELVAVRGRLVGDEEILQTLKAFGIRHIHAFGTRFPYSELEGSLIQRFEGGTTNPYHVLPSHMRAARDGKSVWVEVPPGRSRRRVVSYGTIIFRMEDEAEAYLRYLRIRRPHSLPHDADGWIFDPDLENGDLGIDVKNYSSLPNLGSIDVSRIGPAGRMANRGVVSAGSVLPMFEVEK